MPEIVVADELLNELAPLGEAAWDYTCGGALTYVPVTNTWTGTVSNLWWKWSTTTTSATNVSNQVWSNWAFQTDATYAITTRPAYITVPRETPDAVRLADMPVPLMRTDDEWAAIRQRQANESRERRRLNAVAITQASNLLAMVLDDLQRVQLEREDHFDVVGASGQLWRICRGTSGNVRAIGVDGVEIMRICAHPEMWDHDGGGHLPTEDVMAAQALHLMHDDLEFLRKANVHRGNRRSLELAPALQVLEQRRVA